MTIQGGNTKNAQYKKKGQLYENRWGLNQFYKILIYMTASHIIQTTYMGSVLVGASYSISVLFKKKQQQLNQIKIATIEQIWSLHKKIYTLTVREIGWSMEGQDKVKVPTRLNKI